MTLIDELDMELLDQIEVEFGSRGKRATDLLKTARWLLTQEDTGLSNLTDPIAHCLRAALESIINSQVVNPPDTGWKQKSREVVKAKERFENTQSGPEEDRQEALRDLLRRIEELDYFHKHANLKNEVKFVATMRRITGVEPYTEDRKLFNNQWNKLSTAVHKGVTRKDIYDLWNDCLKLFNKFFLSPEQRQYRLKKLAEKDNPLEEDIESVSNLTSTPFHARYFFSHCNNPRWLHLLENEVILDPPTNISKPWAGFSAVNSLGKKYPSEVAEWLVSLAQKFEREPIRLQYIALAGLNVIENSTPVILQMLYELAKKHPEDLTLIAFATRGMAEYTNPKDITITNMVDFLLNKNTWPVTIKIEALLDKYVEGICRDNAEDRLKILYHKIDKVDEPDYGEVRYKYAGSIGDWGTYYKDDRYEEDTFIRLISVLIKVLDKCRQYICTRKLLSIVNELPDNVKNRTRSWLLSRATDIDRSVLIKEIAKAIANRYPTGDDLPLLDKIINEMDHNLYVNDWRKVLDYAPSVEEVSQVLESNNIPKKWRCIAQWLALLPNEIQGTWAEPVIIIWDKLGRMSRDYLAKSPSTEELLKPVKSPMSHDMLKSLPPLEAARRVANWRPDPSDWTVSARNLGPTLEGVIKDTPSEWLSDPVSIVSILNHPTYIAHYLRAATEIIRSQAVPIEELSVNDLMEVVELVFSNPWEPTKVLSDLNQNWLWAEISGLDLIEGLAIYNIGFGSHPNEIWEILKSKAEDQTIPSILTEIDDHMTVAINRMNTRALQVALSFIAYEFHTPNGEIRCEALVLLENSLKLTGDDGAQFRAIIAPRIGLLHYVAPEWIARNKDLLFGTSAPGNLGQITLNLALKWGQPNVWLLSNFRQEVKRAVQQKVERSLDHFFTAILWKLPNYSICETINFLYSLSGPPMEHISNIAGHTMSRLISGPEIPENYLETAIEFWESLVQDDRAKQNLDLIKGFGRMSRVELLDSNTWTLITLETLTITDDHIDLPWDVAERAAQLYPSSDTLNLMNRLVRCINNSEWEQHLVIRHANTLLKKADSLKDTDEYIRLHTALLERGEFDLS